MGNCMSHSYSIYFYYDKNGQPLYIGKSVNVYLRHLGHKGDSWMPLATHIGIRTYNTAADMHIAEPYYVVTKKPRFNSEFLEDYVDDSDMPQLGLIEYTEEIIYSISDFCDKYGPTIKKALISAAEIKREKMQKDKIEKGLARLTRRYPDAEHVGVPDIKDIVCIFSKPGNTLEHNAIYYTAYYTAPGIGEVKNPNKDIVNKFIQAWENASISEDPFVEFTVYCSDDEYVIEPALTEDSIVHWTVGSVSLRTQRHVKGASCYVSYRLPSLYRIVEYIAQNDHDVSHIDKNMLREAA